jgi:hypothetical protein|eukprot:COSAG02_NODE_4471_length_5328_cov_3.132721_2_plen_150_part_00
MGIYGTNVDRPLVRSVCALEVALALRALSRCTLWLRSYVAAAVLRGKIFAVGGSATPAGPCTKPSVCPAPDSPGKDYPVVCIHLRADRHRDLIIAASLTGGVLPRLSAGALSSVEIYDPETNKWLPGQRTIIARSSHAVAGRISQKLLA